MTLTPPEVLFSEEAVQKRVGEIAAEVTGSFAGRELTVVTLMKSCLIFMSDLIRRVPLDMTCHFLRVASNREPGAAVTDIVYSTEIPYEGRHILLLDDIVDTGITLSFLLDQVRERKPASLRVCALIDKPGERKIDVHPDWAAFTILQPMDRFLVGYGLDFAEHYRGLPFIGTVPRPAPPPRAPQTTDSSGVGRQ
jgi:hypoxanthine phosphoribosyltransferase